MDPFSLGDFVESLWLDMKGKYKRMIAALKNHNSGRNTAPENVDYIFIDAMKFAHDALENRPVQSSFARPISFRIEEHPAEFPSQRMLLREQLRNERQIATNNTIWGNPTRERRKVEFYETDLPPTVPPSDAFALAKQRRKRVLLDQLDHQYEKILDKMQKIDEKTEKNVCSSVFFNPIRNVLTNIDDSIKKVFYEDVTKIVEAYK